MNTFAVIEAKKVHFLYRKTIEIPCYERLTSVYVGKALSLKEGRALKNSPVDYFSEVARRRAGV